MEKQHKNTAENNTYILATVTAFYEKATTDFLIGYHFRKIATTSGHHPLKPPMEAFAEHIPRIALFWRMQLLGASKPEEVEPFDLLSIHRQLSIRQGEIGRWILLFKETLDQQGDHPLKGPWLEKLTHFETIFRVKL